MPASIAHMVIAHKAMDRLKENGFADLAAFAAKIDDPTKGTLYRAYMNLGSIGPDLYYYASMVKAGWDMLTDGFVQATGVTPWAYHLHSCRPNEFPLNLCEVLFSDAVRRNGKVELLDDDMYKLAYIAGHLTHIAADQIIHPLVNSIAEPYYRDGKNRKKHQECEVFQDFFLYEEVYRDKRAVLKGRAKKDYDFFKQRFDRWVDCIPKRTTSRNTHDWFRYFLQRGFVEAYGMFPEEDMIEDSVDNLLKVLRFCTIKGPYKKAAEEYERYGEESPMYREYITEPDYLGHYEEAVRLSAVYIAALYEVYTTLKAGGDFTKTKGRFRKIVSDADLSCPLQKGILRKAQVALANPKAGGAKYKPVFAKA